jgi:hypothetical protein
MTSLVPIALAAMAVCAAIHVHAEPQHSGGQACQADALEQWYCASDPQGTAVLDKLGRVVCAPGACVKLEVEGEEDWTCASTPGGRAAVAPPASPVCDGGCRKPEATECKKR